MFTRIALFLAQAACDFAAAMFLARFVLQWARVSFRNPIGQFVIAVTDWAVRPTRKLVPGLFGLDLASLLLAFLVQLAFLGLAFALTPLGPSPLALLAGALVEVLRLAIHLAMLVVLVAAILSWVNPYAPLAPLFDQLARPLLVPIRRFVPPLGGVDLSPLVLLLLLQVLLMLLDGARAAAFAVPM
jgi:YggT family protein